MSAVFCLGASFIVAMRHLAPRAKCPLDILYSLGPGRAIRATW